MFRVWVRTSIVRPPKITWSSLFTELSVWIFWSRAPFCPTVVPKDTKYETGNPMVMQQEVQTKVGQSFAGRMGHPENEL